jgi:nicotinamide riboside kinase
LRIAITGVPGVGKTELARELAKRLMLPFVTTPAEIIFSPSDSKEKLFKKQYAALFEQLKAEKAKNGFVTDRPVFSFYAYWCLYFSPHEPESRRFEKCYSAVPYDLVVCISPDEFEDEREDRLDEYLVTCMVKYENRLLLPKAPVPEMVAEVLDMLDSYGGGRWVVRCG